MTYQAPPYCARSAAEAGSQAAQLRHVLSLVERIAGKDSSMGGDGALDENARIAALYETAPAIRQRRFDAVAAETASWAAAAVRTLVDADENGRSAAAAERLADELARALGRLSAIVRG
jgi:hypothetical protein